MQGFKLGLAELCKPTNKTMDHFVTCLYNLAHDETGYPPIADDFLNNVLFILPSLHGDFKTKALEIIMWRSEAVPKLFQELQSKNLLGQIRHRDLDLQLVILRLVNKCANTFTLSQLASIFPALSGWPPCLWCIGVFKSLWN